ncbi:MAG: tetratricopeptide repeat protein [Phycisphaerales bacterium]|nr:tetratricopeptide repeat protein [Phycisphaerales bacterium]
MMMSPAAPNAAKRWLAIIPALLLAGVLVVVALKATSSSSPTGAAAPTPQSQAAAASKDAADRAAAAKKAMDAAAAQVDAGEIETALVILEGALVELPHDQQLRLMYAETLAMSGDFASAYEQADQAIPLGPDHPEYRHAAAMYANKAGLPEQAEAQWLMAQKLDPNNPKYPLDLGLVQYKLSNLPEAKKNLLVATRLAPDAAEAWAVLAQIALDEDHPSVGLQHIARARSLKPDMWQLRLTESRLLRRENRPDDAAQTMLDIDESILLMNNPALEEATASLGMQNDFARAASLYTKAAAQRPRDAELAYWCAYWLDRAGDAKRAFDYARRAELGGHPLAGPLRERLAQVAPE